MVLFFCLTTLQNWQNCPAALTNHSGFLSIQLGFFRTSRGGANTPEQIAADLDIQIEKLKDSILELENKKAASVTEFDNKIAAVKEKIVKLEAKKKDVLTPKKRKPRKSKADQIKLLVKQAQKSGMKLDEIADKLGMALPE